MATKTNEWAKRNERDTLAQADHHRELWTTDEIERVAKLTDTVTDVEIALILGRSLYAIWALQTRVRNEGLEGVLQRRTPPAPTAWDLGYDYVTTFPPGWE